MTRQRGGLRACPSSRHATTLGLGAGDAANTPRLRQCAIAKIFSFAPDPNQFTESCRLVPIRGAIARRHERGAGCGGRGSVRRCLGMAGRVDKARELTNGTQTNGAWPVEAFG